MIGSLLQNWVLLNLWHKGFLIFISLSNWDVASSYVLSLWTLCIPLYFCLQTDELFWVHPFPVCFVKWDQQLPQNILFPCLKERFSAFQILSREFFHYPAEMTSSVLRQQLPECLPTKSVFSTLGFWKQKLFLSQWARLPCGNNHKIPAFLW